MPGDSDGWAGSQLRDVKGQTETHFLCVGQESLPPWTNQEGRLPHLESRPGNALGLWNTNDLKHTGGMQQEG